ncbi:MAG: hypothetical protein K6F75_11800 [Butyrivibrio sp.]|nr:hypothetical protein [Butyrivibrio sp.]
MSETGTEQVKEEVLSKAATQQDELIKIAKKQLFFQRLSAICIAIMMLSVVFAVMKILPQIETTLSHVNDVAVKAQDSLAQVDVMTDELVKTTANLNKLVDDNAEELTNAVKSISEIDFEGLNKAITDLQGAVGPVSSFFGRFR